MAGVGGREIRRNVIFFFFLSVREQEAVNDLSRTRRGVPRAPRRPSEGGCGGGMGCRGVPGTLVVTAATAAAATLPATLRGATLAGPLTEAAAAPPQGKEVLK